MYRKMAEGERELAPDWTRGPQPSELTLRISGDGGVANSGKRAVEIVRLALVVHEHVQSATL